MNLVVKMKKSLLLFVFVFTSIFILLGCEIDSVTQPTPAEPVKEDTATEHSNSDKLDIAEFIFFDIGQGDSSLIVSPSGETILIDTGRHDDDRILGLLQQEQVEKIDLLVLTHPHADHIGNADKVINKYQPKEIWMSGDTHTSKTFERVIDAALESGADYHEPAVGETHVIGDFTLDILNPSELTGELNDGSIAFNLTYGDIVFLYTGDAEKKAEQDMVNSGLLKKVDILKVGHHGSNSSSQDFFLNEIMPTVAIYSAESGNSYGHPHNEPIARLNKVNADIYGTDVNGTIRVLTDGVEYEVIPERE